MKLRPYQTEALDASMKAWQSGITNQLICCPTGTGKTVLFAHLKQHHNIERRLLVLVHREELAQQALDKLRHWNPGIKVGLEMANDQSSPWDDIVVASVPSIGREGSDRIKKFRRTDFDAVVVDEAHHSIAASYHRIFSHFRLLEPGNQKLLLGVTATPNRGDGVGLCHVYQKIVYEMQILDAIREGWLADIRGYRIRSGTSLDGVKVRAGDFEVADLGKTVNTSTRNSLIVQKWRERAPDRPTVVFCVDIRHAQDLADAFQNKGIKADAIWGTDPDRKAKLKSHRKGTIRVLTNCNVLSEGCDDWRIQCIVMARPTKSRLLWTQMCGRGLRIPEGVNNLVEYIASGHNPSKTDCLLLDITDNCTKHSLVTLNTIFGLEQDLEGESVSETRSLSAKPKDLNRDYSRRVPERPKPDSVRGYPEWVDLFDGPDAPEVAENSELAWKRFQDGYLLSFPGKDRLEIYIDLLGNYVISGGIKGRATFQDGIPSLAEAFGRADKFLRLYGPDLEKLVRRGARRRKEEPTAVQRALAKALHIKLPDEVSRAEASEMIARSSGAKGSDCC